MDGKKMVTIPLVVMTLAVGSILHYTNIILVVFQNEITIGLYYNVHDIEINYEKYILYF